MVTRCHLFSFVVTCFHSLSLVVPLVVTCCTTRCHSLSFVVPHVVIRCHLLYHSLSFVVTCCHSLSLAVPHVVTRCTTRFHSLSLDIPLVCLFINDRINTHILDKIITKILLSQKKKYVCFQRYSVA